MIKWLKDLFTEKDRKIKSLESDRDFWENLFKEEEERLFDMSIANCDLRDKIKKLEEKVIELDPFQ